MRENIINILEKNLNTCFNDLTISPTKNIIKEVPLQEEYYTLSELTIEVEKVAKEYNINVDDIKIDVNDEEAAYSYAYITLSFKVEVQKSIEEIETQKRKFFERKAWYSLYTTFSKMNIKRIHGNHETWKSFKDTTIYDLYLNKDFEKLYSYYSLFFQFEEQVETI